MGTKGVILSTKDIEGTKLTTIQEAREFMSNALKDPGLRLGYVANIAMKINDNQRQQPMHTRYKLETVSDCNKMAEDLLKLIFD